MEKEGHSGTPGTCAHESVGLNIAICSEAAFVFQSISALAEFLLLW